MIFKKANDKIKQGQLKPMKEETRMTDEARKAQREYYRVWREKNPEKVKQIRDRFWERKGKRLKEKEQREA